MTMREDAQFIIDKVIDSALPDKAVIRALDDITFPGRIYLVSIGKAAWQMANAAYDVLHDKITDGIVITKHGHSKGPVGSLIIREGGHPVPDNASFDATKQALDMTSDLTSKDTVLFLISGGGSALFEYPAVPQEEIESITKQLLASGADIVEINTIRKRLSKVKGGRFALHCSPATVYSVILSDVIGDPPDMIASGPAYPDSSSKEDAISIIKKYDLTVTEQALCLMQIETPKELDNIRIKITGSVKQLCSDAALYCKELGYLPTILTDSLTASAAESGRFLAAIARYHTCPEIPLAFIAGGETVVKLTGDGMGGRNQELALAAAEGISELKSTAVFSVGSDGTDGPTDAAGGYVDENTNRLLLSKGISIPAVLARNDSYNALKECNGLIFTGPTGTNVNDFCVILMK